MVDGLVIVFALLVGVGVRTLDARGGRGTVLSLAAATMFAAYSSAAGLHGHAAEWALLGSIGLVCAGTTPARSSLGVAARNTGAVIATTAYLLLTAITTQLAIPAGTASFLQLAVIVLGTLIASRQSTAEEQRAFRRGVVTLAAAEAAAALTELLVLGRPGFWDYPSAFGDGAVLLNPFLGDSVERMAGSTGHPIVLAMLLAVAASVVVASPGDFGSRPMRAALLTLIGGGLVAAGTRSSVIACLLFVGYCVATSPSNQRVWRVMATLLTAVVGAVQGATVLVQQVSELVDSGSYTNRAGSIASAPDLLTERPTLEALFGSGWGSEGRLFDRGFFSQNGFEIVDNQFVSTLACSGLIGLVLFVAILLSGWRSGTRTSRAVLLVVVAMGFSFDFLGWGGPAVLLFAFLGQSIPKPTVTEQSSTTGRTHQLIGV